MRDNFISQVSNGEIAVWEDARAADRRRAKRDAKEAKRERIRLLYPEDPDKMADVEVSGVAQLIGTIVAVPLGLLIAITTLAFVWKFVAIYLAGVAVLVASMFVLPLVAFSEAYNGLSLAIGWPLAFILVFFLFRSFEGKK
jgi:hypothetical protein